MAQGLRFGLGRLAWLLIYVLPGPRWAKLGILAAAVCVVMLTRTRRA